MRAHRRSCWCISSTSRCWGTTPAGRRPPPSSCAATRTWRSKRWGGGGPAGAGCSRRRCRSQPAHRHHCMRHLPSLPPLGPRSWRTWLCPCCWTPPASWPSWLWPPYRQTCALTTSSQVPEDVPACPALPALSCAAPIPTVCTVELLQGQLRPAGHRHACSITGAQPAKRGCTPPAPPRPAPPRPAPPAVCTALSAICHIVSPELVGVFLPQVTALLRHDRDLVKKKALLAMHRFIQVDPAVAPDVERHLIDKIGYKVGAARQRAACGPAFGALPGWVGLASLCRGRCTRLPVPTA